MLALASFEGDKVRTLFSALIISISFAAALRPAVAADLKLGSTDTVQTALTAQKGARVTVRLRSGQEVTGAVREVNARIVQLGGVTGKEFFDAVVPLEAIDAIFVRVKE